MSGRLNKEAYEEESFEIQVKILLSSSVFVINFTHDSVSWDAGKPSVVH